MDLITLGGIDGMSEMQRNDAAGTVLGFLSRVLCLEVPQLRGHYRPHYFQESPKESRRPRIRDRWRELARAVLID